MNFWITSKRRMWQQWLRQGALAACLGIITPTLAVAQQKLSVKNRTDGDASAARMYLALTEFPETVGYVSWKTAQQPQSQRWLAAQTALAARHGMTATSLETGLKSLASRLLSESGTPSLDRARAHLIRLELPQAEMEALRVVRSQASASDNSMAMLIAIISAVEGGRADDAETHLRAMIRRLQDGTKLPWWVDDTGRAAHLAGRLGLQSEQLSLLQQLFLRCGQEFGSQDARTLQWQNRLGNLLYQMDRPIEAANVLMPLWIELRALYGDTAVGTLTIAVSLVDVLKAAGKPVEANAMRAKLMRISPAAREMLAAKDAPPPAETVDVTTPKGRSKRVQELSDRSDAAANLYAEGRYKEAEVNWLELESQAIRDLGLKDELTLQIRNNLAATLNHTGRAEVAEKIFRELIQIRETDVKPNWGTLLEYRNNVAISLSVQERHYEALSEHMRVSNLREKHLGRYHPQTINARQNTGADLMELMRLCEAALLMQNVVIDRTLAQGPGHFSTIKCRRMLASCYSNLGLKVLALQSDEQILAQMLDTYGPKHPESLESRINLAWDLLRCCEFDEAVNQAEKAEVIANEESLGHGKDRMEELHQEADEILKKARYCRDGYKQAQLIEKVTAIDSMVLTAYPKDHPARLNPHSAEVEKLWRSKDEKKALAECDAILAESQTLKELNGPANFHVRHLRADCLRRLDRSGEALGDLQELLKHALEKLGHEDSFTFAVRFSLGQTLRKLGGVREAEPHLRQVAAHYALRHGERHEAALIARYFHAAVLAEQGSYEEARWHLWRVKNGFLQTRQETGLPVDMTTHMLVATSYTVIYEDLPSPVPYRVNVPQASSGPRSSVTSKSSDDPRARYEQMSKGQTHPFFTPSHPSVRLPAAPPPAGSSTPWAPISPPELWPGPDNWPKIPDSPPRPLPSALWQK